MKLQIRNIAGTSLYEADANSISELLCLAVKDLANLGWANLGRANLHGADLGGANLGWANLGGANLGWADLGGANLGWANLGWANLGWANLGWANLGGANLHGADLGRAYLGGANLGGANLHGADLGRAYLGGAKFADNTVIETGETWKEYLSSVVPALLTAGGKALSEVLTPNIWDCHSWNNCPMAEAFSTNDIKGVPVLLRPRAEQFIRYFDARLIPMEAVGNAA